MPTAAVWCQIERDPVPVRNGLGRLGSTQVLRSGFAEYEMVSPQTNVVRVPDGLTEEEAVGWVVPSGRWSAVMSDSAG